MYRFYRPFGLILTILAGTLCGLTIPLATAQASQGSDGCNPYRPTNTTGQQISNFDGWRTQEPSAVGGASTQVNTYSPWVESAGDQVLQHGWYTTVWSMVAEPSSAYHVAQVGYAEAYGNSGGGNGQPGSERVFFVEFEGIAYQVTPAPSTGLSSTPYLENQYIYNTLYDTNPNDQTYRKYQFQIGAPGVSAADVYQNGYPFPLQYDYSWAPTNAQIYGEVHTIDDQMPGDSVTPLQLTNSGLYFGSWQAMDQGSATSTGPTSTSGSSTIFYGDNKVSSNQLNVWDWSCKPPHKVDGYIRSDGAAGFALDQYGNPWPQGGASPEFPSAYWGGWSIARGVAMDPCDTSGNSGYTLDGYGGVHPFESAPSVDISGYWSGFDIARKLALNPCNSGGVPVSGYVLDGYGGVHPFAQHGYSMIPTPSISGYWPNFDIARDLAVTSYGQGYVLDGYGGVHPFGNAPTLSPPPPYWSGFDIARSLTMLPDGSGGYVLDGYGGVHNFGSAPAESGSGYWPNQDIAKAIMSYGDGTKGYVLDHCGGLNPYGGALNLSANGYYC